MRGDVYASLENHFSAIPKTEEPYGKDGSQCQSGVWRAQGGRPLAAVGVNLNVWKGHRACVQARGTPRGHSVKTLAWLGRGLRVREAGAPWSQGSNGNKADS